MSADEIAKLIAGGETLTVEFKSDREKLPDRALVEALAAMANTDGGVLRYGRQKPEYAFSEFDVVLRIPREKADFNFLDFVNDYEKATGEEAKVDFLLVASELAKRRSLTFEQILDLTQRDEKCIREYLNKWSAQEIVRESAVQGEYVLVPKALRKIAGKAIYVRQSDAEIEANRRKVESCLRFEGTINRAKIMRVCQLSEKQTNVILRKMCESGEITKVGGGRSTRYQLSAGIVPSV